MWKKSTENYGKPELNLILRKLPPLVKPKIFPDEIMRQFLSTDEIEAMRKHLLKYQGGVHYRGWSDYRTKIEDSLLFIWGEVIKA